MNLSRIKTGLIGLVAGMLVMISSFSNTATANSLIMGGNPELTDPVTYSSEVTLIHYIKGLESRDARDGRFLEGPITPQIEIYIRQIPNFFPDGETRLGLDTRGVDSMTDVNFEITGRQLIQLTKVTLGHIIVPIPHVGGENMVGKKIIMKLYERVEDGAGSFSYVHTGTYNGWNMHYSQQKIEILCQESAIGLDGQFCPSHKIVMSFSRNKEADFNNDGIVDLQDFAQLSEDWGKPAGNYLTDISGSEGKSDGLVDLYDLVSFAQDWMQ